MAIDYIAALTTTTPGIVGLVLLIATILLLAVCSYMRHPVLIGTTALVGIVDVIVLLHVFGIIKIAWITANLGVIA